MRKIFFLWYLGVVLGLSWALSGCLSSGSPVFKKASREVFPTIRANASFKPFLEPLGTAYAIEKNPVLRHGVNYPAKVMNNAMQKEDPFVPNPDDKTLMLFAAEERYKEQGLAS